MSCRKLSASECTPESTLEFFITHDYICKLFFDSMGATGLGGVKGSGREVCWACMGGGGSWSGIKMCYRHFPKVRKPHNHKNPDNQARTVNLKNETEFPSDI